jgi:hypothetical protein
MGDAQQALRRAEMARTAGRRMVARGERPLYRIEVIQATPDVRVRVVELPWLVGVAASTRDVSAAGRALIAGWLDVSPEAFDVDRA